MFISLRTLKFPIFPLLLCFSSCFSARAQTPVSPSPAPSSAPQRNPSSGARARTIGQVAVSPDGKRLAWIQRGEIFVAPLDGLDKSQPITAASAPDLHCSESDILWSPDSAALAFLSDCAHLGEQADLYLARFDGSSVSRLSNLHGYVASPAFSPDGSSIAFLYVEGATRPAGALAAEPLPSGVIGQDHVEIQRVARVTLPSPPACQPSATPDQRPQASQAPCLVSLFGFLTPPDLHVFEFDWAPDSQSLAYIAADPPGENNWWVAKLYTQAISVGAAGPDSGTQDSQIPKPTAILAPSEVSGPLHGLQIAVPRWSPDAKSIAFIGGLMSDQGVTGGDVWIVPAIGGAPRDLTPNRPTSAQWITWQNNRFIFSSELVGGDSQLVGIMVPDQGPGDLVQAPLFNLPASVSAGGFDHSLSSTGGRSLFVFTASSFDRPPEIYAVQAPEAKARRGSSTTAPADPSGFAALQQLSHFNEALKPSWGETVSLNWTNDGFHIQGWLMLPVHYDPAKKYPLIVEVHGGPASAVGSRWAGGAGGFSATTYSALGYFVLMPNPRGSYGQGEAFTQANRKDFGYGDLRDILAGVDTVLARYSVDPNRVGLTGWSYGGFMSMFAPTQTHRFRAVVAGAGISDWLSYYGENSIDQWMIPYFGASVYDDPQVYAKSSAIDFIKNVTTPTLVVVGDRDGECPAPQSFEFWHALRDLQVPTELVVYPNEGHGFVDPDHRRDVMQRAVEWFARYMPPAR